MPTGATARAGSRRRSPPSSRPPSAASSPAPSSCCAVSPRAEAARRRAPGENRLGPLGLRALLARPATGHAAERDPRAVIDEAPHHAEDRALQDERREQLGQRDLAVPRVRRLLSVDQAPDPLEHLRGEHPGEHAADQAYGHEHELQHLDGTLLGPPCSARFLEIPPAARAKTT